MIKIRPRKNLRGLISVIALFFSFDSDVIICYDCTEPSLSYYDKMVRFLFCISSYLVNGGNSYGQFR